MSDYVRLFCFKRTSAYVFRISDWSADVCASDLQALNWIDLGQAVESDPAHQLGKSIVALAIPDFPDAMIRLPPIVADHSPETREELLLIVLQRPASRDELRRRGDDGAIKVELHLLMGRVAHAHGFRSAIAR